jgi:potassium-transporting ATPase KdpC subunit
MQKQLMPGLLMTILLTILTGLVYPGIITGLCQAIFPRQANGSLIVRNGKVVGSRLIGQNFSQPEYFWPRPSAAGNDGYDATASSGSNLGPTNKKLIDSVQSRVEDFRKKNPDFHGQIPIDMVTSSASGLDPDISPESAVAQEARVAKARGASEEQIRDLINKHTAGRDLGFLGEPRVNVLELNLALDDQFPVKK